MTLHSELRQDLVSGDWILIAPGRLRYQDLGTRLKATKKRKIAPIKNCVFENPFLHVSNKVILKYAKPERVKFKNHKNNNWEILVLENKYPAVKHCDSSVKIQKKGLYATIAGIGHHDLVITRDHNANFPKLSFQEAFHVFEAFRDRYLMLLADSNIAYISIFHNWGPWAGASVYHPHYQILGIPVVPPDIGHSLRGSSVYFRRYKKCVHCFMIQEERREKKRIIAENKEAVAFAPYVSRAPFEIRIFPKRHEPYFENTFDEVLMGVTEILQKTLSLVQKNLHDPDYNFFIHTAPVKNKNYYRHYHWHIEVLPKFNIRAGFELGTGIEINIIDPDLAARILRK